MIQLKDIPFEELSPKTQESLLQYQNEVGNVESDFNGCKERAGILFTKYNVSTNRVFKEVKSKLLAMRRGVNRCHYCEDNNPNQIEHFKPKSLFPELCFVWDNYLYACSGCNSKKSNTFPLYDGNKINQYKPQERFNGSPLFINPRYENPMDYLFLSLPEKASVQCSPEMGEEVFAFAPSWTPEEDNFKYLKAKTTIDKLKINDADLRQQRCKAFCDYVQYLRSFPQIIDELERENMIYNLKIHNHPTVWHEMKRQYIKHRDEPTEDFNPEWAYLFTLLPEALGW